MREADLVNAKLFRADFSHNNLQKTNLENASMRSSSLSGANLQEAVFNAANLSNSRLTRADFSNASLEESNLWASRVSGSVFTKANFKAANLLATGLNKKFALSEFPDIKFSKRTCWDDERFKRHSVSAAHAHTIETEAARRGFFSRVFRRR